MKIRLQILLILVLGLAAKVEAQNYITLFDALTLEPLPYAHVSLTNIESSKTSKTTSNEFGIIEVPFNSETQIEISYVGYESYSKMIQPQRTGIIYIFPIDIEVNEVVVTGNPVETSTKESMFEVRILDKEELEQRAAVSLSDALMNELNVQISRDGVLGSQVNLQGLGGNNVKIMIDGVPVIGRLDGNLDLSQINMNNIERIEIVEGPLSAVYGSNAIAGVINLITKQNQGNKIEAFVNGFYESIGTYNVDALVGFKKNKHFVQLSGGRYFFDGWNPGEYDRDMQWNPKEQYFGTLNYVYRTNKDWFHKGKVNYFQDRILNRYDPAGNIPVAFDDWYFTKRMDVNYIVTGEINEHWKLNSTNSYNHYARIKNKYQKDLSSLESTLLLDNDTEDNQDTTFANQWMTRTFFSYSNPNKFYSLQTGIDVNIENGKGGRFSEEDGSAAIITDLAFFISAPLKFNEKISLQPALRYGYNSQFKVLPTPSLQFKYDINPALTFRFNYGMGFRAPSLKEMYLVFNDANHNIYGNRDLIPEQSQNVSTSLQFNKQKETHKYGINTKLFYNYKYNAIALTPDDNNVFQYINVSNFTSLGAQIDGKYQYKNLSINLGASVTGLTNSIFEAENGKQALQFFSQAQANTSYLFRKANLSLALYTKWNGKRKDFRLVGIDNSPEEIEIQSYTLMDFNIQKGFWDNRIRIQAGIKNLLNVSNITGTSSSTSHSGGDDQTQIAAGRTYFIGLKIGTKN